MKSIILLVLALTLPLYSVKAQKFVKHKEKYPDFVWYEIKYPNGDIGISVGNKKNLIANNERGYTSVEYLRNHYAFKVKKEGFVGIINKSGGEIIAPDKFCSIKAEEEYDFRNTYKCYQVEVGKSDYGVNLVGIIDIKGKEILPCVYKNIKLEYERIFVGTNDKKVFWFYTERKDNVAGNTYYGVCDTTGVHIFSSADYNLIMPDFKRNPTTYDLSSNIVGYTVVNNNKWGICDRNGYEILAPAYEHSNIEDEQGRLLICFKQNGKEGIADMQGNILIAPRYDNIYTRNTDGHWYFIIKNNNKEGVCDANGVEIIPPVIESSIIWQNGYKTKKDEKWVTINLQDFINPSQKISLQENQWVLANTNGIFSIRAYDVLEWDEEERKYVGSLQGYTTTIDQLGKEDNSIAKQIFEEAYNLPDDNIYEKMALYNLLIEVDCNNKEGYHALALNNIGVMYDNNGDEDTALRFYDKASAMGNSRASSNAAQIRKARRAAARAERLQRISDALGQINNALSSYSSTSGYSSYSNSSYNQLQTSGSSGKGGNAGARQSAYNHMANRAASLYSKLKDKNGYVGSARTHSVDVSTYNSLRSKMRNYRISAQRDGITLQKSQYEDLSL